MKTEWKKQRHKMTTYLTWKEMYQQAYDPQYMDFGSNGTNAARALWHFDLQGEQHPQTRQLSHSPLERAFFAIGDEVSRVNGKLWNFQGRKESRKPRLSLGTMVAGAMSGFTAAAIVMCQKSAGDHRWAVPF